MANKRRKMYLRMVTSSLIRRASRLIIAVLAIAIGATILSGLVTIYYDIPRQLGREFRSYGANLLLLPKGDGKILRADLAKVRELLGNDRFLRAVGIDRREIAVLLPYQLYLTGEIQLRPKPPCLCPFAADGRAFLPLEDKPCRQQRQPPPDVPLVYGVQVVDLTRAYSYRHSRPRQSRTF